MSNACRVSQVLRASIVPSCNALRRLVGRKACASSIGPLRHTGEATQNSSAGSVGAVMERRTVPPALVSRKRRAGRARRGLRRLHGG